MNNVWRVDTGLLTCVAVNKDNLADNTPFDYWLPVMLGDGHYRYFFLEEEAKLALIEVIDERIAYLQRAKDEL
jgi:hypothetical protein